MYRMKILRARDRQKSMPLALHMGLFQDELADLVLLTFLVCIHIVPPQRAVAVDTVEIAHDVQPSHQNTLHLWPRVHVHGRLKQIRLPTLPLESFGNDAIVRGQMALAPLANVVLRPFLSNDVLDYWPAHPLRTLGSRRRRRRVKDGGEGRTSQELFRGNIFYL